MNTGAPAKGGFCTGTIVESNMNQARVLMYGWELPPHNSGGLGVACYGMAKGLASQGVQIAFALPRRLRVNIPFMDVYSPHIPGVSVTAINSSLQPYLSQAWYYRNYRYLASEAMQHSSSLYDEAMRYGHVAAQWSKNTSHALIHAHDWMTFSAAMETKQVSGKPWIAHVHATEFDRAGGNVDQRIAEIEYQGLQDADKIIAVSQYTKNVIQERYTVSADKIQVVHNGVDPVEFSGQDVRRMFPNDNIVLFVGRLTYQKGVDYFLQAASQVLRTNPNTVFVIAGSGDQEHKLLMDAAYLGIGQRTIFAGHLRGTHLNSLYQIADVFVMPSVSEPYGIVALEAIASGTPTIISKQSGVAETVSHVHKVDFWDVSQIAHHIRQVIDYPQLAHEMNRLARHETRSLTWQTAAQKIISVYDQLA